MDNDKVIRFPGFGSKAAPTKTTDQKPTDEKPALGPDGLTDDQRKAIQLVLSGNAFVLVALKPTDRGADFFTAVHGDPTDLRNAQPHLDGVIERALSRKGI